MKVAVSFLKSNHDTTKTIELINKTDADYIHVDIMDGKFVENTTLQYNDLKDILIQDYKFKIYTDSSNGNLGVIKIDYILIPLNEIREIRNQVEITDKF